MAWQSLPPWSLALTGRVSLSSSQVLAATMLGQGKTCWQAEIDAISEAVDFLRFNTK